VFYYFRAPGLAFPTFGQKMKKLLKVVLPPFVGFAVYFVIIRYSSLYFTLRIDEMGTGTLTGFMAFYRYLLPLLFTVAVLTQLLIILPIWNNVIDKPGAAKIKAAILLIIICALLAAGISYTIWDPHNGLRHLIKVFFFMTAVQMIYWAINLFVLKLFK
jgi:hypothetical protein